MDALLCLFLLNLRAKTRRFFLRLREPGPLILTVIIVVGAILLFLILSTLGRSMWNRETIAAVVPLVMLVMLAGSVINPQAQRQLFFSTAEVIFLFPGPFSRRHLLAFKWIQGTLTAMVPALMFAAWLRGSTPGGFFGVFLGVWLIFLYLAAVGLALRFMVAFLPRLRGRIIGLVILAVLFLAGAWQAAGVFTGAEFAEVVLASGIEGVVNLIRSTWLGFMLLAPFEPFGRFLGAETGFDFLTSGLICLLLYTGVVGFLFWADIDFRESSIRSSARLERHLAKVEQGEFIGLNPPKGRPRITLPSLPALGGAGAIIWRQLLVGLRGMRGAVIGFLLPLVVLVGVIYFTDGLPEAGFGETFLWGVLIWVSLSFSGTGLTCDFRADLPHIDLLKTLPISPVAMALGQIVPATFLLWLLQITALVFLVMLDAVDPAMAGLAALAFIPFNLLLFIGENLAILLFPLHPKKPGGNQITARGLLVFLIKATVIASIALFGGGLGALAAYWVNSIPVGVAVGGAVILGACALCTYAIAAAFVRFDPSRQWAPEEG